VKTFLALLAVLALGFALYTHPASLGRACLEGKPVACGTLALFSIGGNGWDVGRECLRGTPVTCGLLSVDAISKG